LKGRWRVGFVGDEKGNKQQNENTNDNDTLDDMKDV
tara:strand:- start:202 stop:309 length:108 start_codon:yes stop_codon:yes gene_type:complete